MVGHSSLKSLWDLLPPETKESIWEHADVLTLYLNNRLTIDEIEEKATDIWTCAFEQDWKGDLNKLPSFGFPTADNALCKVTSRSMYERICNIRPHLRFDIYGTSRDLIKVFLVNNLRYGWISRQGVPVIALDDDDEIEP
ncbi:hypothetical protein HDU76_003395, partial [Blyttiomyces sp. JEL0837]